MDFYDVYNYNIGIVSNITEFISALVWFFPRMNSLVLSKIITLRERFIKMITFVWFMSCMDPYMS